MEHFRPEQDQCEISSEVHDLQGMWRVIKWLLASSALA
jgi:hypothetical protein